MSMPVARMAGSFAARAYTARARSSGTPNLFSDFPVEIFACDPESTSGLTRTEIGATLPCSLERRACAELCQRAQHRLVGVGLQRITDQHPFAGKGVAEYPVMAFQRRGRIAIEGRSNRLRQFDEIHRLGVKNAVAIVEVIHGWTRVKTLANIKSAAPESVAV